MKDYTKPEIERIEIEIEDIIQTSGVSGDVTINPDGPGQGGMARSANLFEGQN